jgi:hypothetical protein
MKNLLTGSDLITDLKIRWIRHFCEPNSDRPQVVQVLLAICDFTLRSSMVDNAQFPGARYIDVPGLTQRQMLEPERYLLNGGLFEQFR